MRRAHLSTPTLLDLYHELMERGFTLPTRRPLSVLDMLQVIDQASEQTCCRISPGAIAIYDVDVPENGELAGCLAAQPEISIGAMGTRAKQRAADEGILLHYTYGVVDKCILRALLGENTVILTNGGMIQRVFDRVEDTPGRVGLLFPSS